MPLAAGLATERLSLHIGQRMRWARGMLQILRTDNPMLGPGLRLPQRLCYAERHAAFPVRHPAPGVPEFPAGLPAAWTRTSSPRRRLAIMAYAVPHIFHAVATNSRIQGSARHSFWSEIYETVMALFLVRLTHGDAAQSQARQVQRHRQGRAAGDRAISTCGAVYPNLILAAVLGVGWAVGVGRHAVHASRPTGLAGADPEHDLADAQPADRRSRHWRWDARRGSCARRRGYSAACRRPSI